MRFAAVRSAHESALRAKRGHKPQCSAEQFVFVFSRGLADHFEFIIIGNASEGSLNGA
jgi:hypothetical protein